MEKRKYIRKKIKVMIDFMDGSDMEIGYTKDIAVGGVFIETERVVRPGSIVFVDFYMPGIKKKLKLKGKVIWVEESKAIGQYKTAGMGIEFLDINESIKLDLKKGINNI